MEVIVLLIGASLIIAVLFLIIFLWAVKSGQYDDTYTPAVRAIFDDASVEPQKTEFLELPSKK